MYLGTTHGSWLPSVQAASLSSCVASVKALAPRCGLQQIHNKQTRMMQLHKQLLLRDTNTRARKPPLGTYKNVCSLNVANLPFQFPKTGSSAVYLSLPEKPV